MTKEKQIEEMAKQLYGNFGLTMTTARNVAKYLTEKKGYRKASEVEKETFDRLSNNMAKEVEGWKKHFESLYKTAKATVRAEVAREIFEEIESKKLFVRDQVGNMRGVVLFEDIAELKKKYTEEK